jgi:UDP-GlcNAc:undecaprenyl-phosphate/decaprenyl-phosphate GlcNAc-1-phosphate transferase
VIRRTAAGKSPFSPDRMHLHHRLLSMGHSHRQSVLLMYLWAALFSGTVVGLSVVRTGLVWLAVVTVVALAALLLVTVPQLRPWHTRETRARAGVHDAAPGFGAPGLPSGLPVPGPAPMPGLYSAPPVSAGPPSSPFPPAPHIPPGPPGPPAMPAWPDAAAITEGHETGEPAETRDASDPASRWSLDDLPAPPRYPRR